MTTHICSNAGDWRVEVGWPEFGGGVVPCWHPPHLPPATPAQYTQVPPHPGRAGGLRWCRGWSPHQLRHPHSCGVGGVPAAWSAEAVPHQLAVTCRPPAAGRGTESHHHRAALTYQLIHLGIIPVRVRHNVSSMQMSLL